ncbi:MAG: GDSL-type esterase/lipase family protein, partial [Planctomycetota bacterium]|nr:GDSL-type esterase/lipase family protein [Planctomycetota bacterium]
PERMATAAYQERYPCYVLAPQCPVGQRWVDIPWAARTFGSLDGAPSPALSAAIEALRETVAAHPIDRERIALTGLSMGGYGAWDLGSRHPEWFNAVAPICGGADVSRASRFAGMSLEVWHGDADGAIPVARSREMIAALKELGLAPAYHELPGVGHDAWVQAYNEGGALELMLAGPRDLGALQRGASHLLAAAVDGKERIAFLGDSITQGGNDKGGYVDQIRGVLNESDEPAAVIPAGISGHKVPNLLARYEKDVIDEGATLVFIYIGINDVWHSTSGKGTAPDVFEKGLRELVRELKATGADVVLATPSVIGEDGEGDLDKLLEGYAALTRTVAEQEGATLCDLRRAFRDYLKTFNPEGADKGVLTRDGVHLNAAGNTFVALQAARSLREAVLARDLPR